MWVVGHLGRTFSQPVAQITRVSRTACEVRECTEASGEVRSSAELRPLSLSATTCRDHVVTDYSKSKSDVHCVRWAHVKGVLCHGASVVEASEAALPSV